MTIRTEHVFFGRRLAAAVFIAYLALGLLIVRLWYLQGVKGSYFRDLSENNRIRTVRTVAPRGTIFDRENRILVGNRPAFNISLIAEDTPDVKATVARVGEIAQRDPAEIEKQLSQQRGKRHFEPKVLLADVSREVLARIKVNTFQLPGVIVEVVPTRFYPFNEMAAQIFGYAREITKGQLEALGSKYRPGDITGQAGIEKRYEVSLSGVSGFREVEVDAMGNRKGELGIVDDLPGTDLYLTIDLDVQRAAEEGLRGKKGAVVAIDPNSGEVLALASSPGFDANIFSGALRTEDWERVSRDKSEPLSNRAISDVYPAGSTFKLVTTVAALAEKKISLTTELNCPGYYMFAGRPYRCHKKSGHGTLALPKALAVSCNSYYFQVGQLLGIGLIEKYAKLLGLGAKTGIDLLGEVPGIVPSEKWKKQLYGQRWYPGDTLPVSIGQGYLVVTPIQMATMISAIGNGGTVYRPYIVRKMLNPTTHEEREFRPHVIRKTKIDPQVFERVREIATGVVNDPRGTGKAAKLPGITVAGKTGTAQTSKLGKEKMGEEFQDHAWFVSFAPVEKPQFASAVLVEHGGHGGTAAAPIAKQIMEAFFQKKGMLPPAETALSPAAVQSPVEAPETPAGADAHDDEEGD